MTTIQIELPDATAQAARAAGLLTPQEGRILVAGQPIGSLTRREIARRIALVPDRS